MDEKKIKNEGLLFALAFFFAISFRLFNLGAIPLSEFEADWAIQAFQIARGQAVVMGPQPAYVILTSMLFSILGSSDAVARLLPALMGSAIIYLPYVLRDKIGRTAALIFAFALGFDPGLISLSRIAGGPILALSFTLLAITFWLKEKTYLAGLMAGLALLSGSAAWIGFAILFISAIVYIIVLKKEISIKKNEIRKLLITAGLVFILFGTYLFRIPDGISAFGSSLLAFLSGFVNNSQIPFGRLLLALISYQSLGILFMIAGLYTIKNEKNENVIFSRLILLVAIAFLLIYPSRQVGDLVWALVPIWLIASRVIADFLRYKTKSNQALVLTQAIVVFSLFTLGWLSMVNFSNLQQPPMLADFINSISQGQFEIFNQLDLATKSYLARIATIILIPLMTLLLTVLAGLWWIPEDSWRAFVWGLSIALLIFMAGSSWSGNYLRSRQVNELWAPGSAAGFPELMMDTLGDISEFGVGTRENIDVVSLVHSDAIAWNLRFMPNLRFTNTLAYNEFPSIVITKDEDSDPSLNSSYRGQNFVLSLNKSWQRNVLPPNFLNWFVFRNTSPIPESVILWVRTDLFPGHLDAVEELIPEDILLPEETP